jgi:transposase
MAEETIALTQRALHRLKVIEAVTDKRLTQTAAGGQLGITERQVKRLVAAYRAEGAAGLVSRRIGQPSNRRLQEALREAIRALLVERYPDFGPTLAQEQLHELHQIEVSIETVRQLQVELGLWQPKRRQGGRAFQRRERRGRFGELIQIDGSPHDGFEGRGPRCTLIVFIDDATGRLLPLWFAPSETTAVYLRVLRRHLEQYGRPVARYSDRHSLFRINPVEPANGATTTPFGRALEGLEIEVRIPAKVATRSEGKWPLVLIQSGPSVRRKAAGDSGQSGRSELAPRHGMGVVTRGRGRLSTRWCVCASSLRSN